jgi:hypothetical protein
MYHTRAVSSQNIIPLVSPVQIGWAVKPLPLSIGRRGSIAKTPSDSA